MKSLEPYDLAVVIINYKTPQLTIDCIRHTYPQLPGNSHIVVVDNNSSDNSIEVITSYLDEIEAEFKDISLIESSENTGFSGGNNLGIKAITAKRYLLLNSDAYPREGAIKILMNHLDTNEKIGLVSPRLEWEDGTPQISCFRFRRPITELIRAAGTNIVTSLFSKFNVPIPIDDSLTAPEWTSFACVMIKREVFETVGYMDEDFFLYYEDIDFCHKINNSNFLINNQPKAKVVHLRGGSSEVKSSTKAKERLPHYVYNSRTLYFLKNYGRTGLALANIFIIFGHVINKVMKLAGKKDDTLCYKEVYDSLINSFSRRK